MKPGTIGHRIFQKPLLRPDISFDLKKAEEKEGVGQAGKGSSLRETLGASVKTKPGKYFVSSEPNWGPKARATGGTKRQKKEEDEEEK